MSKAMARTAAGGSHGNAPAVPGGQHGRSLTPASMIILAATLLAIGLRVYYQYSRPGFLLGVNEYDDGPYFGSAVRLVHGVLPYRSFVLVQPPGITLLMTPAAALTYLIGTSWGLVIGRILTVLAAAASVVLGGLLVRHRGLAAVIAACGILAVYPDGVAAAHTVLVEPWLVLFCLLGALAVFNGDRLTGARRRLVWGGVAFGFAGAVEAWAIVPVLVVTLICLMEPRQGGTGLLDLRRAARFLAGVAAGFLVPTLPFAALGPRGFYQSLITAQIGYRARTFRVGPWPRLENLFGLITTDRWGHHIILLAAVLVLAFVAGGQFIAWLATNRAAPSLDWFAMLTGLLVLFMFMWPPQFHYHFAAFFAPFLALSIALTLSRLATAAAGARGAATAGVSRWVAPGAAGLAAVVIAVMAGFQAQSEGVVPHVIGPIPAAIDRLIPPGACVLTDQVSVTIAADRFVSSVPGCPKMVDSLGTDLALSGGLKPTTGAGRDPTVLSAWLTAFQHAQYVLLTPTNGRRVPWSPTLFGYLNQHFTMLKPSAKLTLYIRNGLPGS